MNFFRFSFFCALTSVVTGVVLCFLSSGLAFGGSTTSTTLPAVSFPLSPTHSFPSSAAVTLPSSAAVPSWSWPFPPPHIVQRSFLAPVHRYAAGHRGIDISTTPGTIVTAPADGEIFFSGFVVDRPVLTIDHGNGIRSSFEPVESHLTPGTHIKRGETIGIVAQGSHCTQLCMHMGVRLYGEYISPLLFLESLKRAILLPLPSPPHLPAPSPAPSTAPFRHARNHQCKSIGAVFRHTRNRCTCPLHPPVQKHQRHEPFSSVHLFRYHRHQTLMLEGEL